MHTCLTFISSKPFILRQTGPHNVITSKYRGCCKINKPHVKPATELISPQVMLASQLCHTGSCCIKGIPWLAYTSPDKMPLVNYHPTCLPMLTNGDGVSLYYYLFFIYFLQYTF